MNIDNFIRCRLKCHFNTSSLRPQEGGTPFHVKEVLGPHTYTGRGLWSTGNAYPGRQETKQTS